MEDVRRKKYTNYHTVYEMFDTNPGTVECSLRPAGEYLTACHRGAVSYTHLQEPDVANDQVRFRKLMKEQADLTPIVEAYTEYKNAKQAITDSEEMLESESDEEMRELLDVYKRQP